MSDPSNDFPSTLEPTSHLVFTPSTELNRAVCEDSVVLEQPVAMSIAAVATHPLSFGTEIQTVVFYSVFSWPKVTGAKTYKQVDQNTLSTYVWPTNIFDQPSPEVIDPTKVSPADLKLYEVGAPIFKGSGLFMLDKQTYAVVRQVYPYSVTGIAGLNGGEPYPETIRHGFDQAIHYSELFGNLITIFAVKQ